MPTSRPHHRSATLTATCWFLSSLLGLGFVSADRSLLAADLELQPASVVLRGPYAQQQIVVGGQQGRRHVDYTSQAQYTSLQPQIAVVTAQGVITPVSDGAAEIRVAAGGQQATVQVIVERSQVREPTSFELDVQPIFTRLGCNAGPCHGKSRGQNGFQLSLLGFYPEFDHSALAHEARGRRVFTSAPEESLLLKKATAQLPHGGGKRLELDSPSYVLIRDWVASGLPRRRAGEPRVERITVYPTERLLGLNAEQQLLVTAFYSDGTQRDVTPWAAFQSNESGIVSVSPAGLMKTSSIAGEATIMARFMGLIATSTASIPQEGEVPADLYTQLPRQNFIDGLVWDKLQRLAITPSAPCDDSTFIRRAYLDVIGTLPTPAETRAFLADQTTDKRAKLIDVLLERPEYADFWANKWVDLLRPNPYRVGIKATLSLDTWVRDAFRKNLPYDQFARELLTAQGSTWRNGATTLFRDRREPDELTTIVSQLFLGIRLDCAKCHHHPFEVYGQEDFYGMAAYFSRIGRKGVGLSPPISGGEEMVFVADSGQVTHPLTGAVVPPKPLFGVTPDIAPDQDPRAAFVLWLTGSDNTYFGQVMSNRVWADLMGRGLVDPVDDLRGTNPASNPALLQALAVDFRDHKYDLKHLIRTVMNSYAYGLSAEPNERNISDTRNYSRHFRRRLRAEMMLDAVCDITGVRENFEGMPPGSRATQIWTHRIDSIFLDSFGRPDPNQDPPCERTSDTTVVQALHLMNSPALHRKVVAEKGTVADLASSTKTPAELVEEVYLLTYCRRPRADEARIAEGLFTLEGVTRKQAIEDLLWALINTPEFVFVN